MLEKAILASAVPLVALAVLVVFVLRPSDTETPVGESTPGSDSAVAGDRIPCSDGQAVSQAFERNDDQFRVVGVLMSSVGNTGVVDGPSGDVPFVMAFDPAVTPPGVIVGDAVDASGSVDEAGTYVASEVKPACAEADDVVIVPPDQVPPSGPAPAPQPVATPAVAAPDGGDSDDEERVPTRNREDDDEPRGAFSRQKERGD